MYGGYDMGTIDSLVGSLWESIKPGETVLVEREGSGDQYFGLYQLVTWGNDMGRAVILVDIMDSLYLNKIKMQLAGLDDSVLARIKVNKIGGIIKTGEVVSKVGDILEPTILAEKFKGIYEALLKDSPKDVITIATGIEKLFLIASDKPASIQAIVSAFARYVGDRRRMSFLMVKTSMLNNSAPYAVDLLEDIATTVIRTTKEGGQNVFTVVKSVNRRMEGLTVKI